VKRVLVRARVKPAVSLRSATQSRTAASPPRCRARNAVPPSCPCNFCGSTAVLPTSSRRRSAAAASRDAPVPRHASPRCALPRCSAPSCAHSRTSMVRRRWCWRRWQRDERSRRASRSDASPCRVEASGGRRAATAVRRRRQCTLSRRGDVDVKRCQRQDVARVDATAHYLVVPRPQCSHLFHVSIARLTWRQDAKERVCSRGDFAVFDRVGVFDRVPQVVEDLACGAAVALPINETYCASPYAARGCTPACRPTTNRARARRFLHSPAQQPARCCHTPCVWPLLTFCRSSSCPATALLSARAPTHCPPSIFSSLPSRPYRPPASACRPPARSACSPATPSPLQS
jgi:hypothetical protein